MRTPRELRERAGIRGDPNQDQYFLDDERVLDRILEYAQDASMSLDHVLEIGPGTGALTSRILAHADRVTAIERDTRLATFLRSEFADAIESGVFYVIDGDALEVDLPSYSACIANLPYGISSEVIFRLLPNGRPILVMVQREFGERMAANPGTNEYGRLSVTSQHYGDVSIREIVPPGAFLPSPPVESAVVQILPRPPSYELEDPDRFFAVVRAIFTQRRKTVRNAIRNTCHISNIEDAETVLDALSPSLIKKRPGELTPEEFAQITNTVTSIDE